MNSIFKVGDMVKVINFGHIVWQNNNGVPKAIDVLPELVGKIGTVKEVIETQGKIKYALSGLTKTAWYEEQQLEKVLSP